MAPPPAGTSPRRLVYQRRRRRRLTVRRTVALVAAAAAALALAGAAQAKELSEVKLCGPHGCAAITDRDTIAKYEMSGDGTEIGTPPLAPYYDLVITVNAAPGEQFDNGATSTSWSQWYV